MIQNTFRQLVSIIRTYPVFFGLNLIFLSASLVFLILHPKGDLLLYFSAHRREFWNVFFIYGTMLGEAYMYILAMIGLLFVGYRLVLAIPLLGVAVTLVSYLLKKFFAMPRPPAYFTQLGRFEELSLISGVKVYMGSNSFPSGHTMSAFALFTFLLLALRAKSGPGIQLLLALLAIVVGLSRIYLMHHFLEDVFLGAIVGMLLGGVWYYRVALRLPVSGKWKR